MRLTVRSAASLGLFCKLIIGFCSLSTFVPGPGQDFLLVKGGLHGCQIGHRKEFRPERVVSPLSRLQADTPCRRPPHQQPLLASPIKTPRMLCRHSHCLQRFKYARGAHAATDTHRYQAVFLTLCAKVMHKLGRKNGTGRAQGVAQCNRAS